MKHLFGTDTVRNGKHRIESVCGMMIRPETETYRLDAVLTHETCVKCLVSAIRHTTGCSELHFFRTMQRHPEWRAFHCFHGEPDE